MGVGDAGAAERTSVSRWDREGDASVAACGKVLQLHPRMKVETGLMPTEHSPDTVLLRAIEQSCDVHDGARCENVLKRPRGIIRLRRHDEGAVVAAQLLLHGAGASIINFDSRWGQESPRLSATYSASKEAVRALSRTVAREWGEHNIRVNAICPGGFTDNASVSMHKEHPEMQKFAMEAFKDNAFGRLGDPYEDVAPIVAFLASDDSHWLSGQTINADGGGWIAA
ncbi:SDR family NAD(P)-dependent oxidoreductase [Micromonospora sp. NBC_01412]|uniref:SDR family NAD(P)-dependent oxidoreductase n=1 Tax=Micromonospora sp. NBC_01412 TaxID=2903590 RepID=UPI0032448E09